MNKKNIGLLVLCFFSITSSAQNIIITDMELNPLAGVQLSSLNDNCKEAGRCDLSDRIYDSGVGDPLRHIDQRVNASALFTNCIVAWRGR